MSVDLTIFGDIETAIVNGATESIVEVCIRIASEARGLAPEGETLFLRDSITWITELQTEGGEHGLAVIAKKSEGYVGTPAFYGVYVELGTRYMPPQPFLRPAAAIVRGGSIDEVLAKIMRESAAGPLREGQTRERF